MAKSWRCALTVCALFSVLGSASGQSQGLYDPGAFRSINLEFKQSDWYDQILQNKAKEIYIKADMQIDGTWYRDVGVRGRGATVAR